MTTAAKAKRRISSQGGVLAELSSRVRKANSRRTGGKRMVVGTGGVSLSNHQITGNTASARRAQGAVKDKEPRDNTS